MTTGEVRMPDAASLPPRSALPRDVDIPVLPRVGTTWYDRGGKYWRRRVALALILVMFLMSLIPEPLAERQARLWVAERPRERGLGTPAG